MQQNSILQRMNYLLNSSLKVEHKQLLVPENVKYSTSDFLAQN